MKRRGRPRKEGSREVVCLSIDRELKLAAQTMADSENRSLSNWIETVISELWRHFSSKKQSE
jgi:predicted HicB family RNase H-like nuclease